MGRKPAKPWAKLDFDFYEDKKVLRLESELGKTGAYDWTKLMALWADPDFHGGLIDCSDPGQMLKLRLKLGRSEKSLVRYLDYLAEIGLIDAGLWNGMRHVTCERAAKDAMAREGRKSGGSNGGKATAEKNGSGEASGAA